MAEDFGASFLRNVAALDGCGLWTLLRNTNLSRSCTGLQCATHVDLVVADLVEASKAGLTDAGFEALSRALRRWCARYLKEQGCVQWMIPPFLWLASKSCQFAVELDRRGKIDEYRKKFVETLRELFQKLHRDHEKVGGSLAVCCELLRLYFSLDQISQCAFLIAAVTQAHGKQPLELENMPKALGVTLCFLWGKCRVLDGNVVEAEGKLGWAFANCLPSAVNNRRRILTYLVPSRMWLGRYPSKAVLIKYSLSYLSGIVRTIAIGDIRGFSSELEEQEGKLIRAGTYLVVEKLKLLAYRNLCRKLHGIVEANMEAEGNAENRHKQDLTLYECAFLWQDDCDASETICILSNLIFIGAIKAYIADEHHKIVFSKDVPFPDVATWGPRA